MLSEREVLSTINMLRSEHLDVRTVTLGINLFDCASHDFDVFEVKVRRLWGARRKGHDPRRTKSH